MEETHVVTCFLRHQGAVLLCQRSPAVGSYEGCWGGVAGHAEGDPAGAARQELREETGLDPETNLEPVRTGETVAVADEDLGVRWIVHPFLFDVDRREITPNEETVAWEWVPPPEILRRETVPDLWTSYDRVRPTVETLAGDTDHGAAWLSIRALEVLRDEAALAAEAGEGDDARPSLERLAEDLLAARPSMPVVRNRVHRAMAAANASATELEAAATATIDRAAEADRRAAAGAAELIDGHRVATLSRSGTVGRALRDGDPEAVLVAESRPGREGVAVAEGLSGAGVDVTLTSDAGLAFELARWDADVLLVGADAILADGSVLNKVGTRGAALSAPSADVTVVVAAATDKIESRAEAPAANLEPRAPTEIYDGACSIAVANVTFDVTPPTAIETFVTERGQHEPGALESIATELRERSSWQR